MKTMLMYICTVGVIMCLVLVFTVFADEETNADFLNSYGWITSEKYIEKSEFTIPKEFDKVYEAYNELQKEAGLDLKPYKGKKAVRYTYTVENYPSDSNSGKVRANVICVKGKPIGGDIMTVSIDGFMHSLIYPKN